ncbi:MAG: nucleotidyltransferase family protein [Chlamydiota bacterium]
MLFNEAKKILTNHKKTLLQLGARALSLFGSVARDESSSTSDIDILIEFDSKKGLFGFINLKSYLEDLLGCEVDLVTKRALHPALRKKILREAKHVF